MEKRVDIVEDARIDMLKFEVCIKRSSHDISLSIIEGKYGLIQASINVQVPRGINQHTGYMVLVPLSRPPFWAPQ